MPPADTAPRKVFLVGPMGSGKTTIGRRLARALGLPFIDADHELEARTGVDIATIFDIEGETGFREREARLLDELTRRDELVLATGGGAVLREDNRRNLSNRGCVVYLRCPEEVLINRTRRDRRRPLLAVADRAAEVRRLVAEREPLYRDVADLIVTTGDRTVARVVRDIRSRLERTCAH